MPETIPVENSILLTVKKLIGGDPTSEHFDVDLITTINAALARAFQLGCGDEVFQIVGESDLWDDLNIPDKTLGMLKTYVHLKTKRVFDPPATATMVEALESSIKELEWCIEVSTHD